MAQLIRRERLKPVVMVLALLVPCASVLNDTVGDNAYPERVGEFILQAGDSSLVVWKLPSPEILKHRQADKLIELGRTLFFDTRLSADNNRSCASCHRPELGWSDGLATALGLDGEPLDRATPALSNLAYADTFNWDGSASSLEEQALQPIYNPNEMGSNPEELLATLKLDAIYRKAFAELFPAEAISEKAVSHALAAFQRSLVLQDTRFDQWVAGDANAMTSSAVRGFEIFLDPQRGSCSTCHAPPNFTDNGFHNIGIESLSTPNPDYGRYNVRPVNLMRGAFKTPSLRNIALTAPYFHDGSVQTLADVIKHYQQGGMCKENLSPEMKTIDLSDQDQKDLIAFLRALSVQNNHQYEMASEQ